MIWNQSETNIWVAGHRGNPAECPENTMASFRNAMEAGLDMIELDIQSVLWMPEVNSAVNIRGKGFLCLRNSLNLQGSTRI